MKTILSCAVTGNITTPQQHPGLPVTPKQIADAAIDAGKAGAAIAHIHVRDPGTGKPSMDLAHYREVMERIRARNPALILNLTTGPGGRYVPSHDDPAVAGPGAGPGRDDRNRDHAVEFTFLGLTHWQTAGGITAVQPGGIFVDILLDPNFRAEVFNSANQQTVLIGDTRVQEAFGVAPDLVDSGLAISAAGGAVCWNAGGIPADCVAWGNFSGHAMMLPFLEQQTVFSSCNFMLNPYQFAVVPPYTYGGLVNSTALNSRMKWA